MTNATCPGALKGTCAPRRVLGACWQKACDWRHLEGRCGASWGGAWPGPRFPADSPPTAAPQQLAARWGGAGVGDGRASRQKGKLEGVLAGTDLSVKL